MMQQIRDGLKGPVILAALVLIILVPFAFSGIEGYLQSSADPVLAKVGDVKITQSQLRAAFDQRYRQLQQMLGEQFRADQIDSSRMREAVLKDMVQESLLRQHARDAGYRASDSALRDYLTQIPAFQDNGKFSAERYREMLARINQTPQRFESQGRDALVIEQLRNAILGSGFATPVEVAARAQLDNQTRDFAWLKFDPASYAASVQISDADIAKRYEDSKATFQAPERLKLAYVELSQAALEKAATPNADVLRTLYDAEKATRFSSPELRHAAHILVSFGSDKAAAKAKVESLAAKLKSGADFAQLARDNSDDPGSKAKGGDVGKVKRGDKLFPEQFENALFALGKAGDTSDPVETEFGWHLIKLLELSPARTQAFEEPEVQRQLAEAFRQAESQKHFQELSSKLEEKAFDSPASLDPVAKELGLKVEMTDWFTRAGGAGIAGNPAVITAAFTPEVLGGNENSKPVTLEPGRIVVVRRAEYEPAHQRELAEVSAQIRETLRQEQMRAKAGSEAPAALTALGKGESLEAAAKAAGVAVQAPGALKRGATGQSRALLDAAFRLPRPAATDKPSTGLATLENGETALIVLRAVVQGAPQGVAANDREALGGAEFAAYRGAIEKLVKVDLKPLPKEDAPAP